MRRQADLDDEKLEEVETALKEAVNDERCLVVFEPSGSLSLSLSLFLCVFLSFLVSLRTGTAYLTE